MSRTIRQLSDKDQVSRVGAEEFVRLSKEAIAARGRFTVALSGGSTPRSLHQLLAASPFKEQVDWSRIEFFWGDERSVPPEHKDSNFGMARDTLLSKLTIPAEHVHRMQAERSDRDQAARDYQAEIARVFGVKGDGPPPSFDLIFLGMGPDGHTLSLFPHTTALNETTPWVVKNFVPKFNTDRLTFTKTMANAAAHVIFLVAGEDKAAPLHEVLEGAPNPQEYPSQMIQPKGELLWLIDAAAGAKLQKR